jgi:uncharacterized protein (DUF488 family)
MEQTIFTIGHSTRSSEEFLSVLEAHRIEVIADVRRLPGSRRLPQFDSATLAQSLAARDIDYQWIAQLGGRRRPVPGSPNTGWRHPAFRAYADHIATEEFAEGLFELLMMGRGLRTAVMCAEVLWWRCHRRLISDVLTVLGVRVLHIRGDEAPTVHRISPPAKVVGGELAYSD